MECGLACPSLMCALRETLENRAITGSSQNSQSHTSKERSVLVSAHLITNETYSTKAVTLAQA